MKSLIYGCGARTKAIMQKYKVDYDKIDFTDSNSEIWNIEYIKGKNVIPNIDIKAERYAFCMIGSEQYSNEIRENILNLGFCERQIIPFEYLNGLWERWKKGITQNLWKELIEDENYSVVKNWYMRGDEAECILKIDNLIFYQVEISVFDLYEKSRDIYVYDISSNKKIGTIDIDGKIKFTVNASEMIIKIVVKDAIGGIPWCSLKNQKCYIREKIDLNRLGKQLIDTYSELQKFPYYDEDYIVISKINHCGVGGTILDVGANYGQSMYAFYNLTNCNIISFEVRPDLYEALLILKEQIDKDCRIEIVNSGISDKEEELIWYEPSDPIMSGSFNEKFIKGRKLKTDIMEKVMKCRPLDQLVNEKDEIWFIKIDVEGLEYEGLKGAKNIIHKYHPIILAEQNEEMPAIVDMLKGEYAVFYYDLYLDKFVEKRQSRLNYWLIPIEEYRSGRVRKLLEGRL